jgi:hypothetical protein
MNENPVTRETAKPEQLTQTPQPGANGDIWVGLAVASAAAVFIFVGLKDEPHFADESAMIAQSYYWTLLKSGQFNHPNWLFYAAYDHPPLPKYFFGIFLDLAGLGAPTSIEPWMNWMRGDFSPPADPRVLFWARVPSALFGIGGIVGVYLIGLQLHNRVGGSVAALLLLINPLYLTHARRAMSDSFTECLVIASVALAMWGCKEIWNSVVRHWRWTLIAFGGSILCGLAALAKLNGGVAAVIVTSALIFSWVLALIARGRPRGNLNLGRPATWIPPVAAAVIGMASFLVFTALNPFMTAHPELGKGYLSLEYMRIDEMGVFARARYLVEFRRDWTRDALSNVAFKKDWLRTTPDRLRMTMWEGFGRFSPLGPRDIRTVEPRPEAEMFTEYRRWCSLVWLPLVVWGLLLCLVDGWRSWLAAQAPVTWWALLYVAATWAFAAFMIPLNWDRYYLPIQAPAALLVAYGIARVATPQRCAALLPLP